MRNFRRSVWFSWPYRYRLVASLFCALVVAALWSINLSAIYPVLKLFQDDKNLQQWVDDEIEGHQKQATAPERIATRDKLHAALKQLEQQPDTPDREKQERGYSAQLAQVQSEISYHESWAYRYQWLRAKLIRHLPTDRFETFMWLLAAVIAGVVVKGLFEFFHESLVGQVTNRTLFDLRNAFFRQTIRQDVRQLAGTGSADLMSRFTNDTEQVGIGLKVLYGRIVGEPLKAFGCLVAACVISWQLTLVFIVVVPLALYLVLCVSRAMRKAAKKVLERMSAMYKILRETFDSIRAVKGFTREAHERRRFRIANREFYRKAMRLINIDAFTNPAVEVLVVLAVGLALASGAYLVLTGRTHIWIFRMTSQPLGFEALLQLYAFLIAIADPVRKLSSVYTKLQGAEAASGRIFELFDRPPEIQANPTGSRLTDVTKQIEFRAVFFAYNPAGDQHTLDDVSLTVKAGETIAIVGGNGCGKTTLLALLPRFIDPDLGSVLIDGVNLRTAHLRSLRKLIGIVTQDTQLFDDTVFANIAYGKRGATREEVIEAARKANAHDFIEKKPAGYATRMGDAGVNFSGGEKQKIALARAILRNPRILILDEFTSQIDAQSEVDIHSAIKEFVKGRTTFLITHKLNTVPEVADRVVMMEAGKILAVDTHTELMNRCEPYRRLFESAQLRKDSGSPARGEVSAPAPSQVSFSSTPTPDSSPNGVETQPPTTQQRDAA
ncbi:MAG: ABC transporter ATP-binding protein/permease [Planctomycetia bacterium]|nr:ABC transporter ATP-binding protein/permease [Planctomycetia bacterium]